MPCRRNALSSTSTSRMARPPRWRVGTQAVVARRCRPAAASLSLQLRGHRPAASAPRSAAPAR
jgi:hypothetical protein